MGTVGFTVGLLVGRLEQENAALRQRNRSRPEGVAAELKERATDLKNRPCASNFPAQCAPALERISALIEDASDRASVGLAKSTSEDKALVRILLLAAVTTKHGPGELQPYGDSGRSWHAWAADTDAAGPCTRAASLLSLSRSWSLLPFRRAPPAGARRPRAPPPPGLAARQAT